jgi:uncharacterized protein (DUF305 family)
MKRPLVVLAVVLASLLVLASATTAVTLLIRDRDDRAQPMMGQPMMGAPAWPGAMHRVGVRGEFSYLTHMIAHHEEAVAAAAELARSERPRMRAFGRRIVETQSAQIEQMQAWLEDWYPGRSTQVDYEPMMRDLSGLDGDRLDRVFLEDMIGHHMMAVMTSQQLLMRDVATHPEVERLAEQIRDEQHDEIVLMRRWLNLWGGPSAGYGPGMMW